ncbi:MAG: zinc ribbon domain-containing protein [Thermoplasmata archaeon]|nr:zinc ribbon domain-containing protein [Thermoplasmata archaeon]MCI4344394.1 zinc ribbon domain-containing protein [Thermoplasmata archaeon]
MADESGRQCEVCGASLPEGASSCPACGASALAPSEKGDASGARSGADPPAPASSPTSAAELTRRLATLQLWNDGSAALGVTLPSLPSWAEELARETPGQDGWIEVVRGVERLAQKRVVTALEEWDRKTKTRLSRLEAYSVDGRLERDQMDDLLHSARTGDIAQALATYQQVDRVVTLKERHLDQAREELERLVSLMRDMEALGMAPPEPPSQVANELERELRGGRLAPLKQRLRSLRTQAVNRLKDQLPAYVTQYGEFLLRERGDGLPVQLEATELGRAAREFARGRAEESLRRLRLLAQVHGTPSARSRRANAPGVGPTGASRTA